MNFSNNPCGEILLDNYNRLVRHRVFYNGRTWIVVINGKRYIDIYCGVTGLSLNNQELIEVRPLRDAIELYLNHDGYAGMTVDEFVNRMTNDRSG